MTSIVLIALGLASGAALAATRRVATDGVRSNVAVPPVRHAWQEEADRSLQLLKPWILLAPVCWTMAVVLLAQVEQQVSTDPFVETAMVLGVMPFLGLSLAAGVALLRVAQVGLDEAREVEGHIVAYTALAWSAGLLGTTAGLTWRGAGLLFGL